MTLKKILLLSIMLTISATEMHGFDLQLFNLSRLRLPQFHFRTRRLLHSLNELHSGDFLQNVRLLPIYLQRYITQMRGFVPAVALVAGVGGHWLLPLWLNPGSLGLGLVVYTYLSQSGLSNQITEVREDVHTLQQTTENNHKENQIALGQLNKKADDHKAATDAGFSQVNNQLTKNHTQTGAKLEQLQMQQAQTNSTVQSVQKTTEQTQTIVLATQRAQEQLTTDVSEIKKQSSATAIEVKKLGQNLDSFKTSTEESFKEQKKDIQNLDTRAEQRHKQTQKDLATLTATTVQVMVGVGQLQKNAQKQNEIANKMLDEIQEAKDRAVALEISLQQQFGTFDDKLDFLVGAAKGSVVKADASSWQNGKVKKIAPIVPKDDEQMRSGNQFYDPSAKDLD